MPLATGGRRETFVKSGTPMAGFASGLTKMVILVQKGCGDPSKVSALPLLPQESA